MTWVFIHHTVCLSVRGLKVFFFLLVVFTDSVEMGIILVAVGRNCERPAFREFCSQLLPRLGYILDSCGGRACTSKPEPIQTRINRDQCSRCQVHISIGRLNPVRPGRPTHDCKGLEVDGRCYTFHRSLPEAHRFSHIKTIPIHRRLKAT